MTAIIDFDNKEEVVMRLKRGDVGAHDRLQAYCGGGELRPAGSVWLEVSGEGRQ